MSLSLKRGMIMLTSKDNVYVNNKTRTFYLSDDIDNSSIGFINSALLTLIEKDNEAERKSKGDFVRKPIKLYVNSFGGSIYDMWGLIDIIEHSETPIYTYCTGYAMSAAFVIFVAGHKRFVSNHATLLYHQISCWRSGTYQDLLEDGEERDWLQNSIESFVKSNTNIKQTRLNTVRKNKIDWYIHADKAIELGIADEII